MVDAKHFLQQAAALREELVGHRRWLHSHAETGFDLSETTNYVNQELINLGLSPQPCGKGGIVADIMGQRPGASVLLRADMDALPIREESELPFAAKNGNMHACGHDMHTAMLLGAAKLLLKNRNAFQGTVRLMFQPAEEILQGAQDMIEAGILEGVDAAMMVHVVSGTSLPTGTVLLPAAGASTPAVDYFTIEITGKGCHGSMPHTGADPIMAACHILPALQEIQTRELAPETRAVLTVGSFQGGTAPNAIADRAVLGGSLRTFEEAVRETVKRRMAEISSSIAAAFRTAAQIRFGPSCPSLINDSALCHKVHGCLRELLDADKVPDLPAYNTAGGGSEDFAFVSRNVPSLMAALAAGQAEQGFLHPVHHPAVRFDEDALPVGSAVYGWSALCLLG